MSEHEPLIKIGRVKMQTRPSRRRHEVDYPKFATYRLRHNVAHDMLRVVGWAASAKSEDYNKVFAAYTRPLIALVFAASAIEGYTNYVGQAVDPEWRHFSHGMLEGKKGRPGIRDKIVRVYAKLGLSVDLREQLFCARRSPFQCARAADAPFP